MASAKRVTPSSLGWKRLVVHHRAPHTPHRRPSFRGWDGQGVHGEAPRGGTERGRGGWRTGRRRGGAGGCPAGPRRGAPSARPRAASSRHLRTHQNRECCDRTHLGMPSLFIPLMRSKKRKKSIIMITIMRKRSTAFAADGTMPRVGHGSSLPTRAVEQASVCWNFPSGIFVFLFLFQLYFLFFKRQIALLFSVITGLKLCGRRRRRR